jgi:hypothetical protein
MSAHRQRRRALLVGLGVFVAVLVSAALLMRVGEPGTTTAAESPASVSDTSATTRPSTAADAPARAPRTRPAQDRDGAVAAALAYTAAPQAWLYMSDDEIRAAIAAIGAPVAADRIAGAVVDEVSTSRSELAEAAGPVWWIVHPLAWRVDRFQSTEATVSVWVLSLLSAADVAIPQTEWTTTTLDLEWTTDGWRIASVHDTPGPTPSIGPADQPWEPEPLDDALEGFTRISWDESR